MNRLSEKQLLIVTVAITVLLTGGLGFLIWSDLQKVEEEEKKIADLRTQIEAAQAEIDQIESREYRVIANREISEKEVAFLPSQTEIENFWDVLERFAEESGVRISGISSKGQSRRSKKVKSTIQSVPQIMSLTATTEEFLHFLNLLENYDRLISVVEYRLSRGGRTDEDGKIRHSVEMSMTTFTYSKNVANTIVSITNYDKKREHPDVKGWLGRIKIEERETYTLRTSVGRRDPFVNVRRKRDDVAGVGEQDLPAQEALLETVVEEVRSLQEGIEIETHLRKIGDLFRLTQQMKENREAFARLKRRIDEIRRDGLVTAKSLLNRFKAEVIEPFSRLEEDIDNGVESSPALTQAQVKEYFDRVTKFFEEREWKKVQDEVRAFAALSRDGKHVTDDARVLALEVLAFEHRTKVIQEFEKRDIKISTILFSPNGMSVAIVNGKTLGEGDALDAEGQVLVQAIGENYVVFETEGVEIKKSQ
jgi:Tfp pilus assembly protein PilO